MLEQAKKDKNDAALAVASIIKVIAMSTLTDAYGDVPYFEALQGYTSGGTEFTPRYDSQKEIYRDMFRLLEEANTLLGAVEGELRRFGGLHVQGRHQEMAQAG